MGRFKFNGISSEDFGLVIQTPPTYVYPERDLINTHVPGRNGDVVIDNNCYKNIERTYLIAKIFVPGTSYYSNFETILDWLNSAKGSYARLEDSYDDKVYRLASFQTSGNFGNIFDKAGTAEIKFICKPQRYLKVGEENIQYTGDMITIENQSKYPSLPEILIKNINTGDYGVLMMTVLDNYGDSVSSISFINYEGNLILNSEDQTVYDDNDVDKYNILSLNGKTFPILNGGISTIQFKKYEIESTDIIPSYSSLLISSQVSCSAEYKVYSAIESEKQEKFMIKSYEHIIDMHKDSYLASSIQTYISSKSESYKFESINTLLNQYAKVFQFTGSLDDNTSEKPTWLEWDAGSSTVKAHETGFFLVNNEDKRIRFIKKGDNIIETVNENAVNSIYYYEASTATTESSVSVNAPKVLSNYYWLKVTYSDIPEWLSFSIDYDSTTGSPSKINYKRKANGYYWTDKTWIFGKAQWTYYTGASYETFNSLSWNTSKKAFVSNEGLTLSTATTYTYKYLNATPSTLPDYSAVTEEKINEETGSKSTEILNPVHFSIRDNGTDLNTLTIYSKEAGYYSIKKDDSDVTPTWLLYNAGVAILTTLKGTVGFEVFYLEEIPDYSDEEDWPDWLNPTPIKTGSDPLAPTAIQFKVKKKAFYRVSSGVEDEVGGADTWGDIKNIDDLVPVSSITKTISDYYYIYMIDEIPTSYLTNRCYTYIVEGELETSETPPAWLIVEQVGTMEEGSSTPNIIKYKVGASGYYKWDSNTSWIKKEISDINEVLFESSGKDDSTIYYISELPEYEEFPHSNLLSITINENSSGNPIEVKYTVLTTGYYRFNNNTNWEYIQSGVTLFNSKVNESNRIYHLNDLEENLDYLEINIKPRWWML